MNRNLSRQSMLVRAISVALFALISLAAAQTFITDAKDPKSKAVANEKTVEKTAPGDLAKHIDAIIDQSEFTSARWGVYAVLLTNGAVIYQRDADKLFTPASNMKIYTTGVALDLLGGDYQWRTSVYANSGPDGSGAIRGDLILYGRGAPDLVSSSKDANKPSLSSLVEQLYQKGIRRIDGNVIGDESYFRGDPLGDGWQWTDLQWYFGAEASALSINGNEVDVNVVPSGNNSQPAEVRVSNAQANLVIQNRMGVSGKEGRPTVGLHRGLSDNTVEVWGEFAPSSKGFGARLAVHDPALWAARLFVEALKARGIQVAGEPQSRNSRSAPSARFDPTKATELAAVVSQPLREIAKATNKESINLNAELILRTLGRERGSMANGAEPAGREAGDDENGLAVVRMWLSKAGVSVAKLALHDGSGLSRLDLVTPETSARLLVAMSKTNSANVFRETLPIAGRDGTIAGRMSNLADQVWAKTGSLTYDNSLSGYVNTPAGFVAFSIMCNDSTGHSPSTHVIDQIVESIATNGSSAATNIQKRQ